MATTRQTIHLRCASDSPRARYALRRLHEQLAALGYRVSRSDEPSGDALAVSLVGEETALPREAFSIVSATGSIKIAAGDDAGLIYGAQRLAEIAADGADLADLDEVREAPRLAFRAIKYDLPWDTYRHSGALSQHQETCGDLAYWEAFLDMMCENRFNVLTLWNLHPYPFLIRPTNFPEASPWSNEEMDAWKRLFSGIFSLAHERGIETYLIPFNIFVPPEFAKAHGVALNNLDHHHLVDGDTSEIVKRYTRECVEQTLREYPLLAGFGLTLGEAMGGMTPAEREAWARETIVEGMRRAGRPCKLIHRIPFSGGTGSVGDTTLEMERVTRAGIEEEAELDFIEKPVWASMKFNWSHPLSTTRLVKVHGGKLYGTYFDPVPRDYRIVWTARNEDFFCLRWGVPDFVRSHITENSHDYVGGYFVGSETYIPAKDYFTRPEFRVPWRYAFERQWLYYLLWGRLLYDRETPDEVFLRACRRRFGSAGDALLEAHALAGRTPLRLGFSFDVTWDFTLYAEAFMALNREGPRVEYISVDRMIEQPPLDPRYVRIADFVSGAWTEGPDRVTPPAMADALEADCTRALELVADVATGDDVALMFEVADVRAWSHLGLFFASRIRGAVALERCRRLGDRGAGADAVRHLESALEQWDAVISITRPLYNDMPLVHLSEQDGRPWHENDHLRFHWEHLRPDVARDVEIARRAVAPD
ncbi:MAG: glycoside hydrolase family 20 zincin-like fold domain-containing protein [bacterium]